MAIAIKINHDMALQYVRSDGKTKATTSHLLMFTLERINKSCGVVKGQKIKYGDAKNLVRY
jgi:hypothetical protein